MVHACVNPEGRRAEAAGAFDPDVASSLQCRLADNRTFAASTRSPGGQAARRRFPKDTVTAKQLLTQYIHHHLRKVRQSGYWNA